MDFPYSCGPHCNSVDGCVGHPTDGAVDAGVYVNCDECGQKITGVDYPSVCGECIHKRLASAASVDTDADQAAATAACRWLAAWGLAPPPGRG